MENGPHHDYPKRPLESIEPDPATRPQLAKRFAPDPPVPTTTANSPIPTLISPASSNLTIEMPYSDFVFLDFYNEGSFGPEYKGHSPLSSFLDQKPQNQPQFLNTPLDCNVLQQTGEKDVIASSESLKKTPEDLISICEEDSTILTSRCGASDIEDIPSGETFHLQKLSSPHQPPSVLTFPWLPLTLVPECTESASLPPQKHALGEAVSRESLEDPEVIAWLRLNFHEDPRSLLSRELVFGLYRKFALDHGKPLMNAACLGKTMRKVFVVMKTRRLGKRGDSKYHYSGIDVLMKENLSNPDMKKTVSTSPDDLESHQEDGVDYLNCRSITGEQTKVRRKKRRNKTASILEEHVVKWLVKNFQSNPDSVISRDFVFKQYRQLCASTKKILMNPACFGKTLRAVFPLMETRRLGSRGSSKYHYAGIAVHPTGEYAEQCEESLAISRAARRQRLRTIPPSRSEIPEKSEAERQYHNREAIEAMKVLKDMMVPGKGILRSLMPPYLRTKSLWSTITTSPCNRTSSPVRALEVEEFFTFFRIHIGMVSHSFVSGALLALPEIFENFWVTRTKSLQIPSECSRQKFAKITAIPTVQEIVKDCYLSAYDLLVQRLMPTLDAVVSSPLAYVLTEFLRIFPFWIRSATAAYSEPNMRAIICHTAAAFAVQLEKLTKLSLLDEEISLVDRGSRPGFNIHCFYHLSNILAHVSSNVPSSNQSDSSRRAVAAIHCMLEQPRDLSRFEELIRRSMAAEYHRLSEQFCGQRLLKEKDEALTALQSGWHDTLGSFVNGDELADKIATAWQLCLSLLIDREKSSLGKSCPTEKVFKTISEQLGCDIPDLPDGEPNLTLDFFIQNHVHSSDFVNSSSLVFFLDSADLRKCFDCNGVPIAHDFRDADAAIAGNPPKESATVIDTYVI